MHLYQTKRNSHLYKKIVFVVFVTIILIIIKNIFVFTFPVRIMGGIFSVKNKILNTETSTNLDIEELKRKDAEILSLKEKLGILENKSFLYVLTNPGYSPYDSFSLLIPSGVSVYVDDPIYISGLKVGSIKKIKGNIAFAELFSFPGSNLKGRLLKNSIDVEARGLGGGAFEVFLPSGPKIEEDEVLAFGDRSISSFLVSQEDNGTIKRLIFGLPFNIYGVSKFEI